MMYDDDDLMPPERVQVHDVRISPYADGKRVKVTFEITPFQQPPNIELTIKDARGDIAAIVQVIETTLESMSFTVHLRSAQQGGDYILHLRVWYVQQGTLQDLSHPFHISL